MKGRLWGFVATTILFMISLPSFAEGRHWNRGRGYSPFVFATEDGVKIKNPTDTIIYDYLNLPENAKDFRIDFRIKNLNGNPAKKYKYTDSEGKQNFIKDPHYGFFITSETDTILFSVKGGEKLTALEPEPVMEISLFDITSGRKREIILNKDINPYDGENLWEIEKERGSLAVSAGDGIIKEIIRSGLDGNLSGFGFFAGWGAEILVTDINLEFIKEGDDPAHTFSKEELDEYLSNSRDNLEGYWVVFDRDLEETLLKPGGTYLLACVKEGEEYKFLYIEGAMINSDGWKPGDIKIILHSTYFPDIFDVEWIDAMKEPLKHDINAQKGEGDTLLFQFPYHSSRLRLRKIPLPSSCGSSSSGSASSETASETSSASSSRAH